MYRYFRSKRNIFPHISVIRSSLSLTKWYLLYHPFIKFIEVNSKKRYLYRYFPYRYLLLDKFAKNLPAKRYRPFIGFRRSLPACPIRGWNLIELNDLYCQIHDTTLNKHKTIWLLVFHLNDKKSNDLIQVTFIAI